MSSRCHNVHFFRCLSAALGIYEQSDDCSIYNNDLVGTQFGNDEIMPANVANFRQSRTV